MRGKQMTYEEKLQKFMAGRRFRSVPEGGQAYLQLHTGDKTPGCAACGSKRTYLLFGIADDGGHFYWVGDKCLKYITWQQELQHREDDRDPELEREAKALARLGTMRPQELH